MAAEEILTLFDLYWFEQALFAGKPPLHPKHAAVRTQAPENHFQQAVLAGKPLLSAREGTESPENRFQIPAMRVLQVRSQSEYILSSVSELNHSTNSIPGISKLQTILSGKEVIEFSEKEAGKPLAVLPIKKKLAGNERKRRKRGGSSLSKSLSDLEFEEMKGFMDLGFVFSEEDKNSSLVSIIPGLQRLGEKENEKKEEKEEESEVCRPYLSEAWDVLDEEIEKRILMNWRVPAMGKSEIDMKENLRFWAHTVASTVR